VAFNSLNDIVVNLLLNPLLVIGAFCYALSLVFYIFVLRNTSLSVAYPIVVSCSIVFVNIASWFMKENISTF